jgi:isopenicillin-N epimerase
VNPLAAHWTLDPSVDYLNHGSFGACPAPVLEFQAELRRRIEREPFRFLARELEPLLDRAREELGRFAGASPDDLAFVPNATTGVNTVLRSLPLAPGDELLTTDHVYNACRNALAFTCARTGARLIVAPVPFPLEGEDAVVEPVLARVTPRTRLALLDHVTSATAVIFPIARLVRQLRSAGVETLVDGAHAPGMVSLDLDGIGAGYYTGNAHKWLCAPKGAAFLHVRRDLQERLHPLVISHGHGAARPGRSRFRLEFDWTGTQDPSPWLAIPEAIRFLAGLLPGGWRELMARNHGLCLAARDIVAGALGVAPGCPDSMAGSMASIPLPALPPGSEAARADADGIMDLFFRRHRIETWLFPWPCDGGRLLRVSAQLYNDEAQYRRLAEASLHLLLGREPPGERRAGRPA